MNKILLFIPLFAALACAQTFSIKQITNLDGDCRNLSGGGLDNGISYFVFEVHTGNISNVYMGQYFPGADSFAVILKVTDDNFMNINPKILFSKDSLFIIYQTNKNGNWDIAYQVYWSNQLSSVYFVADSSADEINPVVSTINAFFPSPFQDRLVSYEKGNSVYIKDLNIPDSIETEVFHGDDSTKYSHVSHEITWTNYVSYIASEKIINDKSFVVYKQYEVKGWGEEIDLISSGTCRNPKIQEYPYPWQYGISYTDEINGKSNIILIEQFSQPIDTLKLFGYPLYNYDNFLVAAPPIITKKQDLFDYVPCTYKASRNDSLFIYINNFDMIYYQSDTLLYTKVNNNNLYLGNFGTLYGNRVFYTIWEDSVSGKIQLFGKRYLYPIGAVNDDYSPSSFTLYQNYPNPFNPGTVINFKLLHRDKVILNVYDLMGRQVCTLLNEDKPAGTYSIDFDSRKFNLSSGIYFYRLITGGYSSVKKMLLLK